MNQQPPTASLKTVSIGAEQLGTTRTSREEMACREIGQVIEMHSPLALVILMLGTNDFQSMHPHNAWHAAQGVRALISAIREAPIEPGMPVPPVLLVTPPLIQTPKGPIAPKFVGGEVKCQGIAQEYEIIARELNCPLFDASSVTPSSAVDGIHLDKDQHHLLGKALADTVSKLLA